MSQFCKLEFIQYAECHFAEYHYAECRGANFTQEVNSPYYIQSFVFVVVVISLEEEAEDSDTVRPGVNFIKLFSFLLTFRESKLERLYLASI